MAEKTNAVRVVEKAEKQAVMKAVNKRFVKKAPESVPFVDTYFDGMHVFFTALGNVLLIVPVLIMAILECISSGFLAGLRKATSSYERHLEGK